MKYKQKTDRRNITIVISQEDYDGIITYFFGLGFVSKCEYIRIAISEYLADHTAQQQPYEYDETKPKIVGTIVTKEVFLRIQEIAIQKKITISAIVRQAIKHKNAKHRKEIDEQREKDRIALNKKLIINKKGVNDGQIYRPNTTNTE